MVWATAMSLFGDWEAAVPWRQMNEKRDGASNLLPDEVTSRFTAVN